MESMSFGSNFRAFDGASAESRCEIERTQVLRDETRSRMPTNIIGIAQSTVMKDVIPKAQTTCYSGN